MERHKTYRYCSILEYEQWRFIPAHTEVSILPMLAPFSLHKEKLSFVAILYVPIFHNFPGKCNCYLTNLNQQKP